MTTGSALDSTTVRLVRKGLQVSKIERGKPTKYGTVSKANGERCWVLWLGARGSSYEWCKNLTVLEKHECPPTP